MELPTIHESNRSPSPARRAPRIPWTIRWIGLALAAGMVATGCTLPVGAAGAVEGLRADSVHEVHEESLACVACHTTGDDGLEAGLFAAASPSPLESSRDAEARLCGGCHESRTRYLAGGAWTD